MADYQTVAGTPLTIYPAFISGQAVYGGSSNSTETLFTPDSYRDILPFLTKPLTHLVNRSPGIEYAINNVIIKLFSVRSFPSA